MVCTCAHVRTFLDIAYFIAYHTTMWSYIYVYTYTSVMNLNQGTTSPFPNAAQRCAHPQVRRLKNSPVMNQLQDHPECKRLACFDWQDMDGGDTWRYELLVVLRGWLTSKTTANACALHFLTVFYIKLLRVDNELAEAFLDCLVSSDGRRVLRGVEPPLCIGDLVCRSAVVLTSACLSQIALGVVWR